MSKHFNVRFIRNFTLEPVELWLKRELSAAGLSIACEFGGFASAMDELEALRVQGEQGESDCLLTVLSLGLEMTAKDFGHATWQAEAICQRHLMLVRAAIVNSPVPVVINTVLAPLFNASGLAVRPGQRSHGELVDDLNREIRALAASNPGKVALVDWTAIARELGEKSTYDYRFWHSSGAPFASPFLKSYAAAIAGVVRALMGKARKCLVLDCDNTLWGGIVGEDGMEGIKLSPDTAPGAYFQAFQRSVLDLHDRGVILALCSKNDEADVLEVVDKHPDCLIRRHHLAAWRVSWSEKAESIAALAAELNIGLDAMVFIDDSVHECELVRAMYPEVLVLQTPDNPEELIGFLERRHLFDAMVVTEDDLKRSHSYQQNREREAFVAKAGGLADYKRLLETKVSVRRAARANVPRIAQLVQRTNQFNLTTRRHDQLAIERFMDDPDAMVLCAEVADRFGDLGLVGVAIILRDGDVARVDTLLMSCRALGRDAEAAFVSALLKSVQSSWGSCCIVADYIATKKNALVADFWLRMGLAPDASPSSDAATVRYVSARMLAELAADNMPAHVTLLDSGNGN